MSNTYDWNRTLKFSWAHIIAFVALIFMTYVMFMGDFYSNEGNFALAAIKIGVIDLALLLVFIGAQVKKGVDEKFASSIKVERIFFVLTFPVFLFALIPYNHFWGVFSQRETVTSLFVQNIDSAKALFTSYDQYVEQRQKRLESILTARKFKQSAHDNYHTILALQLSSGAVQSLEKSSKAWLAEAGESPTVWNAFLIGNATNIQETLHDINQQLIENATPTLSVEGDNVPSFSEVSLVGKIDEGFNLLKSLYSQSSGISLNTLWSAIFLYLMLLFPYIIQERNTRAAGYYHLSPWAKTTRDELQDIMLEEKEMKSTYDEDTLEGYNIHSQDEVGGSGSSKSSTNATQSTPNNETNNTYVGTF